MKQVKAAKSLGRSIVLIALLVPFFASVQADDKTPGRYGMDCDHQGMGPGMMGGEYGMGAGMMGGGYGMGQGMGMMGLHGVYMLDLTDDQRSKINAIQDKMRKQNWEVMGKMMDERSALRDLYNADTLDSKKIGAVYDRIFKLKRQMIDVGIKAHNDVNAVLTKEQREQLKQYRHGRGMYGPGAGRGVGGRGPMGQGGQMGPGGTMGPGMMGQ